MINIITVTIYAHAYCSFCTWIYDWHHHCNLSGHISSKLGSNWRRYICLALHNTDVCTRRLLLVRCLRGSYNRIGRNRPPQDQVPCLPCRWLKWDIISYPLFADADVGIYPHAASQYHPQPKTKRGIAMLRRYPTLKWCLSNYKTFLQF